MGLSCSEVGKNSLYFLKHAEYSKLMCRDNDKRCWFRVLLVCIEHGNCSV